MRACLLLILFILFMGCKKEAPESGPSHELGCGPLDTIAGPDTNYIPHRLNNTWVYCHDGLTMTSKIIKDSTGGKCRFFSKTRSWINKYSGGNEVENIKIDSLGIYTTSGPNNSYVDTIVIIDPHASNGDTLCKNKVTGSYSVLINKNEKYYALPRIVKGCYHVRVHFYWGGWDMVYKKGIGLLYDGGVLTKSTIH